MNILMIAGEVAPYAKTGGLGEVMGALPKAVKRLGHDVRVFMPLYGNIDRSRFAFVPIGSPTVLTVNNEPTPVQFHASILAQEVPIYFLESARFFPPGHPPYDHEIGNIAYYAFNQSVFALLETLDWIPDVIHCHDWHAGLIPNFIKSLPETSPYKQIATVESIHNSAFKGLTTYEDKEHLDDGEGEVPGGDKDIRAINFLKRGIRNADIVTTVSEQYARELLVPETSHGLHEDLQPRADTFFGIRNGVDYAVWNPLFDTHIPVNYDIEIMHRKYDNKRALQHRLGLPIDDRIPLLGMNSRITEQKGFSLVFEIFDELMKAGVQIVVVGTGMGTYVEFLEEKMRQYPEQVAFQPYSEALGSLVYAGCDIFLMPSLFEPSGLGQLVSLRYGSVPVVRRTGGLADTITDYAARGGGGNGFVFDEYKGEALIEAIKRALRLYKQKDKWWQLMLKGMAQSYSWLIPARKYVRIYRAATKEHKGEPWTPIKK